MSPNKFALRRRLENLLGQAHATAEQRRQLFEQSRRNFLKTTALAGAGASALTSASLLQAATPAHAESSAPTFLNEVSIAKLQKMMMDGSLTSVQLVNYY